MIVGSVHVTAVERELGTHTEASITGRRLSARSGRLVNFVSFTTRPVIYMPFDVGYEKNADLMGSGAVGRKKQVEYSRGKNADQATQLNAMLAVELQRQLMAFQ